MEIWSRGLLTYSWLKDLNHIENLGNWRFRLAPRGTRGSNVGGGLELAEWVAGVPVEGVGSRSS